MRATMTFTSANTMKTAANTIDASACPAQGCVKNLGRYAASRSAWWPKRPSSTAALT